MEQYTADMYNLTTKDIKLELEEQDGTTTKTRKKGIV